MRTTGIALVLIIAILSGCTTRIPGRVTAEEYQLYSEWLRIRFAKEPPTSLYLVPQTFAFDPVQHGCGETLRKQGGVSSSLIQQLRQLGEATYPIDIYGTRKIDIPWSYKVFDVYSCSSVIPTSPTMLHIISFSRVAFNRRHDEALFAISDSCGGECGGGGSVVGQRTAGKWVFRSDLRGNCRWIY